MRRLQAFAGATLALLLLSPAASAQQEPPLVGDRPDFTESAARVPPCRVQVEAGVTFSDAEETETLEVGELLIRVGLTDTFELRFGVNSYAEVDAARGRDVSGLVDSAVGAKVGLGEASGWTTALVLGTSLPTGDDDLGDSAMQPEVVFVAERDLGEDVSLGTNFGYTYARVNGERFNEVFASASLELGLSERVGAFVEVFGFVPSNKGGPETYFFDAGVTRLLRPNLRLDLRAGVGLNSAADDYFVGTGVVWRR